MRVLVTGGTGFIGRALVRRLCARGDAVTVLSRRPSAAVQGLFEAPVTAWRDLSEWTPEIPFDAVINLAGEPIVDRPWTADRKQALRDSRVGLTAALIAAITAAKHRPAVLLSGSAIGIYGDTGRIARTESGALGDDFSAHLCRDWEQAALAAQALGVRTVLLRTGLVLHADGGMLAKMRLPFKLGLGSRLGDGRQMMSWIHRHDYLNALLFLLDDGKAQGAYNLTAPEPVSNREFSDALAASFGRKARLAAPAFVLKRVLGQRSILLLGGQSVLPHRLLAAGFRFRFHHLPDALQAAELD